MTQEAIATLSNLTQPYWEQVHRPIEFYGKVVDENEQPVEGADVEFGWTHFQPDSYTKTNVKSDSGGFFSLSAATGATLSVHVQKPGYYLAKTLNTNSFNYSPSLTAQPFQPDARNPVLFHIRKRGPGTDLVTSQYGVKQKLGVEVPVDGTPVSVDLMTGRVGEGGQLQIAQTKPERSGVSGAKEWSFQMAVPDGGFVEENDEFPFEAPEGGYRPIVQLVFKAGTTNWMTNFKKSYYIAFGKPRRYGRLMVETGIGMAGARLEYAINPDGSRYLEPK
jgi:hypothetical protein